MIQVGKTTIKEPDIKMAGYEELDVGYGNGYKITYPMNIVEQACHILGFNFKRCEIRVKFFRKKEPSKRFPSPIESDIKLA